MLRTAEQTEQLIFDLLRQWGDALLRLQVDLPSQPELDGGILCPCCKTIHGRCHEAAYPLLALAGRTGKKDYLTAAKKVFLWGDNMRCPDGSFRNDAGAIWAGTTVFGAIALHDALFYHGRLLSDVEKAEWEDRLLQMGGWAYKNLRPAKTQAYLNYYAANACLMALLGNRFHKPDYLDLGRDLVSFCLSHTSENGLLYGEGHPLDATTEKGCRAVDAGGYNVEETLPLLTRCAEALPDDEMLLRCRDLWRAHLTWMLPDGAWDDSAGSRAFKWTYWGSRTSDGCQEALFMLGRRDPVFAEAALRNTGLLVRCTHSGLLYGGPDYEKNGEKPCVHHTFCHAKTLAGCLDRGLYAFERTALPSETAKGAVRFPELDLLRITHGGWIADVSGYNYSRTPGDHASGGTLSLLWHERTGPLIASGAADYKIREPQNQQLPSDPSFHRSPCPRVETEFDGVRFAQYYDQKASLRFRESADGVSVFVGAGLCDRQGNSLPENGALDLRYTFTENALQITGSLSPEIAKKTRFVLPLIGESATVSVTQGTLFGKPERFFNLNPGFLGYKYQIQPDETGKFKFVISV